MVGGRLTSLFMIPVYSLENYWEFSTIMHSRLFLINRQHPPWGFRMKRQCLSDKWLSKNTHAIEQAPCLTIIVKWRKRLERFFVKLRFGAWYSYQSVQFFGQHNCASSRATSSKTVSKLKLLEIFQKQLCVLFNHQMRINECYNGSVDLTGERTTRGNACFSRKQARRETQLLLSSSDIVL